MPNEGAAIAETRLKSYGPRISVEGLDHMRFVRIHFADWMQANRGARVEKPIYIKQVFSALRVSGR